MKTKYRILLGIPAIILLAYGFCEGFEWYRILALFVGAALLSIATRKPKPE